MSGMVAAQPVRARVRQGLAGLRMALVLSFGGSLRRWHEQGILTREIEIYLQYLAQGIVDRLYIFSYAHDDDIALIEAAPELLRRIVILRPQHPLRTRLSRLLYSLDGSRMRALRTEGVGLAKTNQVSGSWVALLLRLYGVRIFARCGYLLSRRHWKNGNFGSFLISFPMEWILFRAADLVSTTTESAAIAVRRRSGGGEKVFVAPTYVDTDVFRADAAAARVEDAVVFVGRLEPQKNVLNLVRACSICGLRLCIVGTGSLERAVVELAAELGTDVRITPVMQNREIAELFRSYRYFVLPSLHEGLPKALIEAMSSEMVCIGTDVGGITDLLADGSTGYLAADLNAPAIAAAIDRARSDPMNVRIAKAARAFVLANHSIRAYLEAEQAAIDRWIRPKLRS